jgi:hypothetical protein
MFGRQERYAIILLLTVLAIVIAAHLILDTIGKRPFASPYSDRSDEGALVILSGTIDDITVTRTGGHLLLQVNETTVFVQNAAAADRSFQKGSTITVIGIVQTYEGKREIAVQSASDILSEP